MSGEIVPKSTHDQAEQKIVQFPRYAGMPYAVRCLPDVQRQRAKLEALRYKWCGYATAFRCMQILGNYGREVWWPLALYTLYRMGKYW